MVAIENILIGTIYSASAFVLTCLNLLVFVTVSVNSEFHTNTYRIIKLMIIGCVIQLASHFLGGIMTIAESTLNYYLERIFGALIQSGWFLYQGASLTLTVDRALIFLTKAGTQKDFYIRFCFVVFSFAIAVLYLVLLLCPGFGFNYVSLHGWFYADTEGSVDLEMLEQVLDFSILSLILLVYLVVFARLLKMRKTGGTNFGSLTLEIRILVISVASFLYELTFLIFFFWGSQVVQDDIIRAATTTVLWIVDCGFFALATIVINATMRKKMFKIHKQTQTLTPVTRIDLH
ncbi:hypothetical protein L596_026780 [Steinernema carpocapsae]|uniref:7TM GPCR serpentine receptor class x (Srx) domain-containing protein n=1 Tax=Steinernema carpocapsae TaxID=34508 RepID=A0A4U5M2D8_STECR|nr:hypothetical protein L596_026780 [Steinernema carpocapsae]